MPFNICYVFVVDSRLIKRVDAINPWAVILSALVVQAVSGLGK